MRQHTRLAFTLIVASVPCSIIASPAHAACSPGQTGTTVDCPLFTAPTKTAVPGQSMVGTGGTGLTMLFNGVVPPNGFMVQINAPNALGIYCTVSDNGPASLGPTFNGFLIGGVYNLTPLPNTFITPPRVQTDRTSQRLSRSRSQRLVRPTLLGNRRT
jgi:hypothetical protein